ncbi:DUF3667 domain-containing protein [Polaribacter sp. Hel1_85]|uniref:DUF3667 domain-containing protein n=1 Tax=Polaribacter sp. Hel1_85 TaxID=1250005 RepID=UPI00052E2B30|nr:DUF3667 domain-containing protein [Polaribacter sp. Hel1_85]KGL58815.1 conserved hypothetical membrane protein [Polaribacter sp. Hel1_85]
MFNGLFNFDAKFWKTLIPLLINPGKVSKDYKEGKRSRYSNPFRFYITVSIIFFLIIGLIMSKKRFDELTKSNKENIVEVVKDDNTKEITQKEIDSLKTLVSDKIDAAIIPIPEAAKNQILKEIEKEAKDTTAIKMSDGNRISFNGGSRLDKFVKYQKKYPDSKIDQALDSLNYDKNFTNRFLYTRAKAANSMVKKDNRDKFISELISYASISLFIFLPIFTLFLKLFYIRRKYTYVDHLIFVFHTQTVLFMLLTIFSIITLFIATENFWIFILLFLLYLFLAMKKFYQQGYFKTFVKFIMLNFVYLLLGTLGVTMVGLISFAFY